MPADAARQAKLAAYNVKFNQAIADRDTAAAAPDDAAFDTEFKKLPLLVDYQPRVGGKSRRRNKKNNKSRRRNQSKRQRK